MYNKFESERKWEYRLITNHETQYTIILTEQELSSLIEEIDSIYKGILDDGNNLESINTLMTLKNALALETRKWLRILP